MVGKKQEILKSLNNYISNNVIPGVRVENTQKDNYTDGEDTASLISHADAALDSAKNNNRGNATVFSEELNIGIARNLYLRTRLRHALEKGEIIAYFQPQVNVISGEIVGIEALARWESKEGHISPGEFIPVAEEYGFIDELSYQIMIEACKWSFS